MTHGNFFSGSGAWELAARLAGIETLFESEIEPFPVALEAKRFPNALQLGDVSKVDGSKIPKVDIMTNSSPCQDISIAGARRGMEEGSGTRSSLFHEVIRITKEMREDDVRRNQRTGKFIRPRFWLWENVPGAFTSNDGEDFREVLEEICKIVQPDTVIPKPSKWPCAGMVDGDGWQVCWRTEDAQFWGVAQRRRRVFIVADFGGHCAGEILFEQESVRRNFAPIAEAWKDSSRSLEDRIDAASRYLRGETEGVVTDSCVR